MNTTKKYALADKSAITHGYNISPTGIYVCKEYEGDILLDSMNVCAICLFVTDEPYNYGDEIAPTRYDGDCDDCGGDSRFYCES